MIKIDVKIKCDKYLEMEEIWIILNLKLIDQRSKCHVVKIY
jgi:hypothetical protein